MFMYMFTLYIYIYIYILYFIYAFIINSVGEHIKIMGSVCYSYNLIIVFKRVFMNTSQKYSYLYSNTSHFLSIRIRIHTI